MTERIDHAAEALSYLHDNYIGFPGNQIRAQVHATLALAEQQRVSNLLAVAAFEFKNADFTKPWDAPDDTPEWRAVRNEVAAVLGLTAGQEGEKDE